MKTFSTSFENPFETHPFKINIKKSKNKTLFFIEPLSLLYNSIQDKEVNISGLGKEQECKSGQTIYLQCQISKNTTISKASIIVKGHLPPVVPEDLKDKTEVTQINIAIGKVTIQGEKIKINQYIDSNLSTDIYCLSTEKSGGKDKNGNDKKIITIYTPIFGVFPI